MYMHFLQCTCVQASTDKDVQQQVNDEVSKSVSETVLPKDDDANSKAASRTSLEMVEKQAHVCLLIQVHMHCLCFYGTFFSL